MATYFNDIEKTEAAVKVEHCMWYKEVHDIDGLTQNYSIFLTNALKILQSCTKWSKIISESYTSIMCSKVTHDIDCFMQDWYLHY